MSVEHGRFVLTYVKKISFRLGVFIFSLQDLTDCVNVMAANVSCTLARITWFFFPDGGEQLTVQVRTIAVATVCDSSLGDRSKLTIFTDGRRAGRLDAKGDGCVCVRRDPAPSEHDQRHD